MDNVLIWDMDQQNRLVRVAPQPPDDATMDVGSIPAEASYSFINLFIHYLLNQPEFCLIK